MLEAVKINTKLGTVGEVSPVLVGLYHLFFWGGVGSEQKNGINVSDIILPALLFFNHVNMSCSQFYGRHFLLTLTHLWPNVTPFGLGAQTWLLTIPFMTTQSLWNSV